MAGSFGDGGVGGNGRMPSVVQWLQASVLKRAPQGSLPFGARGQHGILREFGSGYIMILTSLLACPVNILSCPKLTGPLGLDSNAC